MLFLLLFFNLFFYSRWHGYFSIIILLVSVLLILILSNSIAFTVTTRADDINPALPKTMEYAIIPVV